MDNSKASPAPYRAPLHHENTSKVPGEVLEAVKAKAKQGDPEDVLRVMDDYAHNVQATIAISDTKGVILDRTVKETQPMTSLELGSYYGYGALRIARLLKPGAMLYAIEVNPDFAEVVKEIIGHAGLSDKVTVILGSASDVIPTLAEKYGVKRIDFAFIDHWKDLYKGDLIRLEQTGLLQKGSVILADNVIRPGCPDYTEYVRNSTKYTNELFEVPLSYRPDLVDGVERSVYQGE